MIPEGVTECTDPECRAHGEMIRLKTRAEKAEAERDEILDAIKALREQAAEERAALHECGEPLTDYSSGMLDGLDKAWIAGTKTRVQQKRHEQITQKENP